MTRKGMGPVRVLIVDHVGGIETNRQKYAILGSDPDVDLTLFVPETWIENQRTVRAERDAENCRVLTGRAGFRGYENRGFFYTGLAGAIARTKPDVLHLNEEPFSLFALQSVLLARLIRPDVKILFYTFDNLRAGFRYPYRPSWFYGLVQRIVQGSSDLGTAGCADAMGILRSRGFRKPARFVPLGVDTSRFRKKDVSKGRAELGLGPFVIGFVGRLVPVKGVHVLLEALPRVEADWSCLVIGDGEQRGSVEDFVRTRGYADRLRIEPGVPHGSVADWLNLMDVLVLPSITMPNSKEQFGRVLIEAMACEVPVIGSDSGSIPEVIGEAGLVFPEGDSEALGRILSGLARDGAERARLAAAGRSRVTRHFSWRRVAETYKNIYDELLRGTPRSEDRPEWSTSSSSSPPSSP
ncbi:MAG: glycosyltransferase family 4 protein [Candidatus Eisenbacteria bacterium]